MNAGKIHEFQCLANGFSLELKSLADYDLRPEIIEDGLNFLENARKKAATVATLTGEAALADDSGLEVDFLSGAPGVYSSSYAGNGATDEMNISKLLQELKGVAFPKRGARFVCTLVISYPDGRYQSFEGYWHGVISEEPRGSNGFGYDPVFYLPDLGKTAAELEPELKNCLSHRAKAMTKLLNFLRTGFKSSGA